MEELAQYFHNLILSEDFELWRFRDIGSIWRVYPQHPLDPRTVLIIRTSLVSFTIEVATDTKILRTFYFFRNL